MKESMEYKHEIIYTNEYRERHRLDGPALINFNISSYRYYRDGFSHRENGPDWSTYDDGDKSWFINSIDIKSEIMTNQKIYG